MNPQSDQTPGLRLPQPSFNVGQAPATPPALAYQPPVPHVPQGQSTQSAMPPAPQQQPQPAAPQPSSLPPATMPAMQDMAAVQSDDENAIDQEWTNKAREIVERTHTDPYLQSRELGKIKAQYIKIRYNKDIKVED